MKKVLSIIVMFMFISSCSDKKEETKLPEGKEIKTNESIVDSDEIINFTKLEGQPDY